MFRLIEDSFWDDPQIARLPKDEKLIVACIFTNVHTRPCGIYRITIERLALMTKIPVAGIKKGLHRLQLDDLAYYDGTELCIPGYIRRQRYKGPQIAHRICQELGQVKNRAFVEMVIERHGEFLKTGGLKIQHRTEEIQVPVKELKFIVSDEVKADVNEARGIIEKAVKNTISSLALDIASCLHFTGGVKPSALAAMIKADPEGEAGIRKAVARAEKYYATAKAEKWKSFIIARRFQKFCDYYGEAFSSDEALEEYIQKIRSANEREIRENKREAHLHIGAHRPEPGPEKKPEREKTTEELRAERILEIQASIERSKKFLEDPYRKVKPNEREMVLGNISRYESELKELQ